MSLALMVYEGESIPKLMLKRRSVVSADIQTAAMGRPIDRERRQNQMAADRQRPPRQSEVTLAVRRLSEKVKYGAIMPEVELAQ